MFLAVIVFNTRNVPHVPTLAKPYAPPVMATGKMNALDAVADVTPNAPNVLAMGNYSGREKARDVIFVKAMGVLTAHYVLRVGK